MLELISYLHGVVKSESPEVSRIRHHKQHPGSPYVVREKGILTFDNQRYIADLEEVAEQHQRLLDLLENMRDEKCRDAPVSAELLNEMLSVLGGSVSRNDKDAFGVHLLNAQLSLVIDRLEKPSVMVYYRDPDRKGVKCIEISVNTVGQLQMAVLLVLEMERSRSQNPNQNQDTKAKSK